MRRCLNFSSGSSSGLVVDPSNPFAVFFPRDSCELSPTAVYQSFRRASAGSTPDSTFTFETVSVSGSEEPDPSMLTVYVNLRKVSEVIS